MATVPATQSFLAGEKVTAAKLTAATKTPIDFLLNPPRVNAFISADVSLPTSTWTLLPFSMEAWDTDGMHSTTTNPSRITINTSGQYLISFYSRFGYHATGYRALNLRLNSAGASTGGSTISTIAIGAAPTTGTFVTRTFEMACTAGDHFELFAYQTSGTTIVADSGQRVTGMEFRWLGLTA